MFKVNNIYKKDGERVREEKGSARFRLPFSKCDPLFCNENFIDEVTKMYGLYRNSANSYSFIHDREMLKTRFNNKNIAEVKATKKLLKLVDETLKNKLDEITDNPVVKTWHREYRIAKLQKVNNDISVMRFCIHRKDTNYEYMRFYITKEANFLCQLDNDGKFHLLNRHINKAMLQAETLCYDKDEIEDTPFKYMLPIIDEVQDYEKAYEIYELFNFEILERLSKTGMPNLVSRSIRDYKNSRLLPTTTIGIYFCCKIDKKETDIFKALGLNKYQYKKLSTFVDTNVKGYRSTAQSAMCFLRLMLKNDKWAAINDIDNKTFDKYLDYAKTLASIDYYSFRNRLEESIPLLKKWYSEEVLLNTIDVMCSTVVSSYNSPEIATLLRDFLNIVI